jgi:Ca-activated chloride channel family protein
VDGGKQFANASVDFKFAAAVAEFGMLLRDSEFKGSGTLGAVLQWAQEGKGADTNGYRTGFLELVRKAQVLKRG